jgi:hypothetical protein
MSLSPKKQEKRGREEESTKHHHHQHYKITILEKGDPEYERFLEISGKMINNVEVALDDIRKELQRLAGRVVHTDYCWDNVIDYVDLYSLDLEKKIKTIIQKQQEEEEEENESDSSSYS